MLKFWLSLTVGAVVPVLPLALLLLLSLHSPEDDDTTSQSEGQRHEPSAPVHVGLEELTVHEAQTRSVVLQYVVVDDEFDEVVQVAAMRLYSQP
jgi:hypothetical protein